MVVESGVVEEIIDLTEPPEEDAGPVDDGRHISTAVHDFEMSADAAASTSPSSEEDCSTALADFIDFMDVLLEEPVENVGLEKQPSGTLKEVHEG